MISTVGFLLLFRLWSQFFLTLFVPTSSLYMAFLSILKYVLSEGLSHALWWVHWSQLKPDISNTGSPSLSSLKPPLAAISYHNFGIQIQYTLIQYVFPDFIEGKTTFSTICSCSIIWFSILFCAVMYANWKFVS